MRVTFPRLADHQQAYAVVERDDGVIYRLYGGTAGPALPHDLRHLVVERELKVTDGIWGGIAAGTVYTSMRLVRGRRPPHAAERSVDLKRAYRDRVLRAELLANLVETVAALDDPSAEEIRRLTGMKLAVLPGAVPVPAPGTSADAALVPPPEAIAAAARAMQVEAARWARLRPGEELEYEWPSWRVPARLVRQRDPGDRGDPRRRSRGRRHPGG
jgi:hypothetical protein